MRLRPPAPVLLRGPAAAAALLAVAACGAQETRPSPYVAAQLAPVRVVAADPGGGPFADAVAEALAARGVAVVPSAQVREAMAAAGVDGAAPARLGGLAFLEGRGVDALLTVAAATRHPGVPTAATATLRRTPDGAILAEARWTPFWGRWSFGLGDRPPVRDEGAAARALAAELGAALAR